MAGSVQNAVLHVAGGKSGFLSRSEANSPVVDVECIAVWTRGPHAEFAMELYTWCSCGSTVTICFYYKIIRRVLLPTVVHSIIHIMVPMWETGPEPL